MQKDKDKKKDEPRDTPREIAETVVFVIVLVLMLKSFVAEAFVIPTGSMAETLLGYHKNVECDRCGYKFPLNCANEVDPPDGGEPSLALKCRCPNCLHEMTLKPRKEGGPTWNSGDRVLVAKFLFDNDHLFRPNRHDVFVFKFPGELSYGAIKGGPQKNNTAMNYIKRCLGLPEETIAIYGGNLYVTKSLKYPAPEGNSNDVWVLPNMHVNDRDAIELLRKSLQRRATERSEPGDFEIIRKAPGTILEMRRIVYDNDFQPTDLAGKIRRWNFAADGPWSGDDPTAPKTYTHSGGADESWLEYKHLLRDRALQTFGRQNPEGFDNDPRRLITNILGYNSGQPEDRFQEGTQWVGDLMLDCKINVTDPQGEIVFELAKGIDRFQARFDVATGECSLVRLTGKLGAKQERQVLAQKPTKMKGAGNYHIRFANFDERLTVWVNPSWFSRGLPFDDGVTYSPAADPNPVGENDLLPARIGAVKAGFKVSHLQLWRDSYYTLTEPRALEELSQHAGDCQTMYVHKGHFLALGDNSSSSADSRSWGLVPERLLLGRALMVYFPFWPFDQRAGLIR